MSAADSKPSILVVDDDETIRALLQATLSHQDFHVFAADGGKAMDVILADTHIDLIVLDSMMPGENGLSICARVRAAKGPPIIMLSAAGDDINRIKGLNLGAEDYMAKPFNAEELAVRIRIVLRRMPVAAEAETVRFFDWSLDNKTRRLTSPAGKILSLSAAEFAVLHVFLGQRDRPLRREQVVKRMAELHGDTSERSLDTLISRLRHKLRYANPERPENEDLIQTVYGTGYMFRPN